VITYAQLLIAFRHEVGDTETLGRWVKRFENIDHVRFGDWFPLGVKEDDDEIQRLVTFVSTDVGAPTVSGSPWSPCVQPTIPSCGYSDS
jgi:hypothetical protein